MQVLEEQIIEQLQTQTFTHIDGRPPFYWDGRPHKIIRTQPLPNPQHHPLNYCIDWENDMSAQRIERLVLRYDGISRERFGITQNQADLFADHKRPIPPGIVECRVAAPALYYIPAHSPHFGEALEDEAGPGGLLSIAFNNKELFLHLKYTYDLHIPEPRFSCYLQQYLTLLEARHTTGAQTILLGLIMELKAYLEQHSPDISNSAWLTFDDHRISIPPSTPRRNIRLCYDVSDYIQQHLHLPLSLEEIAHLNQISTVHLNRVFKATIGTTLMRFVTLCRIEAAKLLLRHSDENVTSIARLVGFSGLTSFDTVFKREVGMTPLCYRSGVPHETHLEKM